MRAGASDAVAKVKQIPLPVKLRDTATFGTFQSGANGVAVAYLRTLGRRTSGAGAWLWGPAGCGKSHLLQAVCAESAEHGHLAAYLPMGQFGPMGREALEGWSGYAIVAMDQVERVVGDPDLETALFTLYNDLSESGAALLAATNAPPSALAFVLPDLRSRLAAGAVFQILPLDEADALAALQRRAQARGLELPAETARYLLHRVPRDMASLCDWLDRLDLASLAAMRRLTVPFVREVLADEDA
jgi:DnaA family protein